ncbi:hypothetical protein FNU76_04045 [Chitinimonas arctica]|uniref:Uncharacterized protein n=1 Tax=Chitinimonas arctica TaxID=2594795 RepID=A0A516SBR7_9NEIS|nr:hypothetical protein [Chitinimonas arctica]QDQ25590.1 hypothetical protein FNU76_04045 [Chitinimonas arctica]
MSRGLMNKLANMPTTDKEAVKASLCRPDGRRGVMVATNADVLLPKRKPVGGPPTLKRKTA